MQCRETEHSEACLFIRVSVYVCICLGLGVQGDNEVMVLSEV